MKFTVPFCLLLSAIILTAIFGGLQTDGKSSALKNAVILVIRHAEKPDHGIELSAEGEAHAQAYVNYFRNFRVDGQPLMLDYLFAAADSKQSHRPRLTIEPVSKAFGLSIDSRFEDEKFQQLAEEIRTRTYGKQMLICWHHEEIPQLIRALGADSGQLFPKAGWPDAVFNWVIQLRYDSDGRLAEAKRIDSNL